MTNREYGLIGGLAVLWGVSFFFSKVVLAELPPVAGDPRRSHLDLLSTALSFVIPPSSRSETG